MAAKAGAAATRLLGRIPQAGGNMVAYARPKLGTFWKYAKVEMKPPMPSEFGQVSQGFNNLLAGAKSGRYLKVTTREAWLNTLITAEIAFWFFVGEVIGRGSLIGYYIPGAWTSADHPGH